MYLTKKVYIFDSERETIEVKKDGKIIDTSNLRQFEFEVGYWRKANAIHKWFVDNVQYGNDDCEEYYVLREQIQELKDTCIKVLEASVLIQDGTITEHTLKDGGLIAEEVPNMVIKDDSVAMELLPSEGGFFFGSTEYNQYYIQDLKHTIEICDKALADNEGDIYYHSSW